MGEKAKSISLAQQKKNLETFEKINTLIEGDFSAKVPDEKNSADVDTAVFFVGSTKDETDGGKDNTSLSIGIVGSDESLSEMFSMLFDRSPKALHLVQSAVGYHKFKNNEPISSEEALTVAKGFSKKL